MGPEPVIGWRLWRLHQDHLMSWTLDHLWNPGENQATCKAPRRCGQSPGHGCLCGLWALWSPAQCLRKACEEGPPRQPAVGLMVAWGTVAVHGTEGFRAERARVICLFQDWPWRPTELPPPPPGLPQRLPSMQFGRRPAPAPDRQARLLQAARRYSVPLVTLRGAVRLGLLAELGVGQEAIEEVQGWSGAA